MRLTTHVGPAVPCCPVSPAPRGSTAVPARLTRRLRPGDVAVIQHVDLDRASAEAMVACRVAAVVNAAESISGRYPALGPQVLASAGIPLVDVGPERDGPGLGRRLAAGA